MKSPFRAGRNAEAVQENVEKLTGQRGNGLDRAITIRELQSLGLVNVIRNSRGQYVPRPAPPVSSENEIVERATAPEGFAGFGGFGAILLEWKGVSYSGHAYTEIWRNTTDVLSEATLIATTPATVFGDVVNPGSAFYYWARHVNVNNIPGPYNSEAGTLVSTTPNVSDVIEEIAEQMRGSALISDLQADISTGDATTNAALEQAESALNDAIARVEREYKAADVTTHAAIRDLETVTSDADMALVQLISQVETAYKTADASLNGKITQVNMALADAEMAMAQRITGVEAAYQSADDVLTGRITTLQQTVTAEDKALSDRIDTTQSSLNGVSATVQGHSQTIAQINENGSAAYQAMWNQKAQAGDIQAGIGILVDSDGTSQVAVSASQFFVFDPNTESPNIQPLFAIDQGNVIIPKALIETATIQILNAQTIIADEVKAGISMSSPVIEGGEFVGGSAGFGTGGPHNGYQTYISPNGTIFTSALDATGFLRAPEISGGSIYGGRIEGGYVLGGVIQGATIIETERKFTVEGNLTYSNGKQVLAVYSASKDFSHSGRPQDGGGHVIFWTNYLDIYPYNVIYANTERRFRWSTIGDQSLSGITARIVDVRSINYSQNCYLYVEYEDALGKVRVQNHWCGDRHSRQFNITTPCGVFVVDYTVNAHSHNVSLRSISSLHNHRLRRFGVRVDQGYVNHIRTFTANAWARNYERKP